jgi:outer membrane protein assembly factor BamD (BamD/ComL family)
VPLDVETLTEEVRQVDRARVALAAGRPAQTLAVLEEYERHFPQHRFAPEALYLRMEALMSLGRAAEARLAAERLLANYPGAPNGARARAVLTKSP